MTNSPVCKQPISITGVILAGGLARRMGGENKAFLKILDKALIQYILKNLEVSLDEILINANQNHKKFDQLGFPVISDHIDDFAGPLAGMAAGLQSAKTSHILVVPCDSPFITDDLVTRFVTAYSQTNADIYVAHDGQRLQPVFALINIGTLPSLLKYLAAGNHKIDRWYEQQKMSIVDFSDAPETFININTPDDLQKAETRMVLKNIDIPIIGFAAHSGSGKTTLLKKLIPALKAKNLRIGLIKHAHHGFELDYPGKDSYELRKAGASQVIIGSQLRWAHIVETPEAEEKPSLANLINHFEFDSLDLILVEGFKLEHIPKIEVFRPSLGKERLSVGQADFIAIASDEACATPDRANDGLTMLDLNNTNEIAEFILVQINTKKLMNNIIKQAPSCTDDFDPNSIDCDIAKQLILDQVEAVSGVEKLAIRSTLGRILAEDIFSPINVPSHTNSAMDGYAIRGQDLPVDSIGEFTLIGTSFAGKPWQGNVDKGECVRIMTGAVMPAGTDTVIMQEHVERDNTRIKIGINHKLGQNVRQAGEDLKIGQLVLSAGSNLDPSELGLISSLGMGELPIKRQVRVAFFSTGDELRSIGETLGEGEIYDSNRYTLFGMLTRLGVDIIDMGVIKDTREAVRNAFDQASSIADIVISSGGVSVGEADYVKEILDELGHMNFWKVAMKPGRPLTFGQIKDATFFGLPGNPVSVMVTFYQFVLPALRKMMGATHIKPLTLKARCTSKLRKRPGRTEFQRGIMETDANGDLIVSVAGQQGSGILRSMSEANCFIVLAKQANAIEPETMVDVQPFSGLI